MEDTANSYGIGFAQKFPALSAKLAGITASKTGLPPTDPSSMAAAMHSNVFKTEAGKAASATDTAAIDRVFTAPKFAPDTASVEDQTKSAFDAREGNIQAGVEAKRGLFGQSQEAAAQLAELSNFNRENYTSARLRELDPVKDLDQRALELRMQAFTAASMLETDPEIMALPPALQERAMASKMQVFSDAIQSIGKVRDQRLSAAKEQIEKEVGARESQINVSKYRVDAIDSQIKQLESIGGDIDTIASLRLDRIKEMDRLNKARAKGGGMTTQKEFVYDALIKDFRASHADRLPTEAEARELQRQTELIVKDPNLLASATKMVPGPEQTETVSLGLPWYRRVSFGGMLPNETTVTSPGSPVSALRTKGFGLPVSADEQDKIDKAAADLARVRQLTAAGAD